MAKTVINTIFEQKILDHGYIKLIESWGSDERIIEAARMSTDKGFQGWGQESEYECPECRYVLGLSLALEQPRLNEILCPNVNHPPVWLERKDFPKGDEKLLEYLWSNKHATPFEMAGLVIEVKAPIMVFREWHRHRTQSYNEMSARYVPLPDENYIPTAERCFMVSGTNRQAGALKGTELTHEKALRWLEHLHECYYECEAVYQEGLAFGIPKEIARLPVPVGRYSKMRASANLRNWLAFLTLRMDSKAQWEIRQFANALGDIISHTHPRTWELFKS